MQKGHFGTVILEYKNIFNIFNPKNIKKKL